MVEYNKEILTKNRVLKHGAGPRDVQRRQQAAHQDNSALLELQETVKNLTLQLSSTATTVNPVVAVPITSPDVYNGPVNLYSAEDFDKELTKELEKAVVEIKYNLESGFKVMISEKESMIYSLTSDLAIASSRLAVLEEKLSSMITLLASKEEIITTLKQRPTAEYTAPVETHTNSRPKMETVFIDPNTAGDSSSLESFIQLKEDITTTKVATADKLSKLKNLIGGLPKR